MEDQTFKYRRSVLMVPIIAIVLIWLIYFIEIKFSYNFNKYGIYPKTFKGLRGILFSPFIHSNANHLFNNSIPLAVMLTSLYYFYNKIANRVLFFGLILSGLLTWLIARPAMHIGASGIVYLLVSFVFFSGIFRKYYRLTALSLIVVFLYGGMVWYIFPTEERISWEGHLSGFLVGFIFSFIFRKMGPQPEKFNFIKNEEFEKLFDEDGNYNPPEELEEKLDIEVKDNNN
ncbi:rhomboid family intramembrane serine protease [Lutibacter flavus]|uniref:Membrane associated serine protease, rhomboid family n=1 Tax=Lutibacter flavus TaxID=691689 RepID=A0A238Y0Q2_9FLAO|nr:rhomboid family intramembrane serine protease [Lutibacter flavus]SNR64560.1 Membrane associated serine protease, rhomboid family [Lutibacter flavus]